MTAPAEREVVVEGIMNLRDLGGLPTTDGHVVRRGLVHRSGHLGSLVAEQGPDGGGGRRATPPDPRSLRAAGIRTVYDLRTEAEVTRSPDQVPEGTEVRHLDVLADATESIAAHLEEVFADPTRAERVFADGVVERHYEQTYRNLVRLDSAREAYGRLFGELARIEEPVLFHCTAGKDRTGWAAAALLTLLRVDRAAVVEDYLHSNEPVLEGFAPLLDQFADMGGDPRVLEPAFLVQRSYLDAAFDAVRADHGSIERYFAEGLGVGAEEQEALRRRLLVPEG